MFKKVIITLGLLLIPFFLGVFLLIVGATIGGNYFVNFQAFGARGYEATGLIGLYVGIAIGVIISTALYINLIHNKTNS